MSELRTKTYLYTPQNMKMVIFYNNFFFMRLGRFLICFVISDILSYQWSINIMKQMQIHSLWREKIHVVCNMHTMYHVISDLVA